MTDELSFRAETETELAEAVAKKVKKRVLRIVTWAGPYGPRDLDEVESKVLGGGRRQARKESVRKQRRGRHSTLQLGAEGRSRASLYRKLGAQVRKSLGLEQPVPVKELGSKLIPAHIIGAPSFAVIWYPTLEWLERIGRGHPRLHIWSVCLRRIQNPTVQTGFGRMTLSEVIHLVSGRLNCHPALALAFLLCELPVEEDEVTVVIHHPVAGEYEADPNIAMYVSSADVPVWVTKYMYRVSRLIVLGARRRIRHQSFTGTPRPRGVSQKVHDLATFVLETNNLRWQQRLSKWNDEHPEWKYDNVNSMRAVYYRAAAKARRPAGRLKSRTAAE